MTIFGGLGDSGMDGLSALLVVVWCLGEMGLGPDRWFLVVVGGEMTFWLLSVHLRFSGGGSMDDGSVLDFGLGSGVGLSLVHFSGRAWPVS